MVTKVKTGASKGANKRPQAKSTSGSTGKAKKASNPKGGAKQHKPAPRTAVRKQKPKKRTYSDKELGIGALNGIVPSGIQKAPNMKKGKKFVEDRQQMDLIMKMVMAEKEGSIESKMLRARQMEEIREARKQEHERRAGEKREGFEERKRDIKEGGKKRRHSEPDAVQVSADAEPKSKKSKKRVSFG